MAQSALAYLPGMAAIFAVAFFGAFIFTPQAEKLCWRFGLVDQPRPGELQKRPAARAGGYAILVAFLLAVAFSFFLFPRSSAEIWRLTGFLIGVLLVIPFALIDDFKRIGPRPQLIAQFVIAIPAVAFGILIDNVSGPFNGLIELPLYIALPISLFWTVGMINTMNFIDTMDGLAAGIAAIAATILFARSFDLGQYSIAVLPLALAGACAGFLPFNFSPARIFAGSGGSFFLGYALAVLAIIGGAKIATAIMVLGLPIADVAVVIIRRLLSGRSPFLGGDGAHLVHRLSANGLPTRRIALLIYALCVVAGLLALLLSSIQKLFLFVAIGLLLAVLILTLLIRAKKATDGAHRPT